MALVSDTIPNLVNGVSQQPASVRLPSQSEEQVNCYPSLVEGLKKRPPSVHVAKVSDAVADTAFSHTINRDASERYKVIITDDDLKVFDLLTGDEKTVAFPDGKDYLEDTGPFGAVSVADYTFIINKTVECALGSTPSDDRDPEGLIYVKQANANTNYIAEVVYGASTYTFTHTTSTSSLQTDVIAAALKTGLEALGGWPGALTISRVGSVLYFTSSADDFELTSRDSWGDNAMIVIKGKVQSFSKLPNLAVEGMVVEVAGDDGTELDNYFVAWESSGVWREVPAPGQVNDYDPETMPHILVREEDGTFTFKEATWETRLAGNDETNQPASFVGRTINDIFFTRNRLGFTAGENVIMSEAGEFFSFWRTTVTTLLDSDPIDYNAAHTKVSVLKWALPFSETLLLFSDETQFRLDAGEALTLKTVKIVPTTEFESDLTAKPVGSGANAYFCQRKGNNTGVREYFVDPESKTNDASDVTGHVPKYVPANVVKIAPSSNEDLLVFLSSDTRNQLYLYKYYWSGEDKVQSSWSRWTFDETDTILDIDMVENMLYLLVNRADGLYIESINVADGAQNDEMGFLVTLDRQVELEGVYDADNNRTTWTLPYSDAGDFQVILGPAWDGQVGRRLNTTHPTATTLRASGDWSEESVLVGRKYTAYCNISTIMMREAGQNGSGKSITTGRLQIGNIGVVYANTSYFRVEVTPPGGVTYTYVFNGRVLGSEQNVIGEVSLASGVFNVPVKSRNTGVSIRIVNDSYLPFSIQSIDWEGNYTARAQRV